MLKKIFAKKMNMSGAYTADGVRVGVTLLSIPRMVVKDTRTKDKNGYDALRLEVDSKSGRKVIREIRTEDIIDPGTEIRFEDLVQPGDKVNVSGISKGRGFAGAVKRHNFKGGPRTHGQSNRERAPGSSGATTTPGRVFKGTRRAGHKGFERAMVKKLKVLSVDPEKRIMTVGGSIPGPVGGTQLLVVEKV